MALNINAQNSLVSVIIPTYNRPQYLKEALASAVNQTYTNIEIIVFDDCSSENPQKIVESFNDHRIRFYRHANNVGIARNVISAFKQAKGKYVASLNDDDIWQEDFLEKLVPHLEANSELALAFSDHYVIDEDNQIDIAATEENTKHWQRDQLRKGIYQPFYEIALVHQAVPCAVATVIRNDAIDWNDFVPQMGPFWDFYLGYLACRTGKGAYYSPDRLSLYRVHSQSESRISGRVNYQAKIRAGKAGVFCYQKFMEDGQLQEFQAYFRDKWLHANTTLAIGLLRSDQIIEARSYLLYVIKQKLNLRAIAALVLSFIPRPLARKFLYLETPTV